MVRYSRDITKDKVQGSADESLTATVEYIVEEESETCAEVSELFMETGHKIPNSDSTEVIALNEGQASRWSRWSNWFGDMRGRVHSVFIRKPKRDAFIASFFDFEDDNKKNN